MIRLRMPVCGLAGSGPNPDFGRSPGAAQEDSGLSTSGVHTVNRLVRTIVLACTHLPEPNVH